MTVGYVGAEGKSDTKNIDRAVTYQSVCSGDGNTEALKVRFDTTKVTIEDLLDVFFASHDATRRTASAQYESAVWPQSEAQYEKVRAYVEAMNENAMMKQRRPIATKIRNPSKTRFAIAERYHQNYNKKNAYRLSAAFGVFLLNLQAPDSFFLQEQLKVLLGAGVVLSSLEQMLPFYDRVLDELEGNVNNNGSSSKDADE